MGKSQFDRIMQNVIENSGGTISKVPVDRRATGESLQQLHAEISAKVKANNLAYDRGLIKIEESNIKI